MLYDRHCLKIQRIIIIFVFYTAMVCDPILR